MSEAPERLVLELRQGITFDAWSECRDPRCAKSEPVEYIRADLVEAAVKRALEGAAECCDVVTMDGIGDIVRAKGDEIRALDPAQFVDGADQ